MRTEYERVVWKKKMFLDVIVWILVSTTLLLDSDDEPVDVVSRVVPGVLDVAGDAAVPPDDHSLSTMMDMPWL